MQDALAEDDMSDRRPSSTPVFSSALRLALAVFLVLLVARSSNAAPLTPEQMDFGVLNNSLAMTASMMLDTFGPVSTTLDYSGLFSDTGWSLTVTGDYGGKAVDLKLAAVFDPSSLQGSYGSSGTIGVATWQGSGTWGFDSANAPSIELEWTAEATVLAAGFDPFAPDRRGNGPWIPTPLDGVTSVQDFGRYRKSLFGIPIPFTDFFRLESDKIVPNNQGSAFASVRLPSEGITIDSTANFAALQSTVAGKITVPEPSLVSLSIVGIIALVGRRRAR
jgi:hypothetical protein